MLFKLTLLHRNLDEAVDMGDGGRCVKSAKYELPVYHKTGKTNNTLDRTCLRPDFISANGTFDHICKVEQITISHWKSTWICSIETAKLPARVIR